MFGILGLGFRLGMQHALEADHNSRQAVVGAVTIAIGATTIYATALA
jgi:hypothetical protein